MQGELCPVGLQARGGLCEEALLRGLLGLQLGGVLSLQLQLLALQLCLLLRALRRHAVAQERLLGGVMRENGGRGGWGWGYIWSWR